jgi:hypothetical protein
LEQALIQRGVVRPLNWIERARMMSKGGLYGDQ